MYYTHLILSQESVLHNYSTSGHHPTLSQAVKELYHWDKCVGLVGEIETSMKNLSLLPSHDNPKSTKYLQLEWNFFGFAAARNVKETALFMMAVLALDKIFIRYFEVGVYRRFTKKLYQSYCRNMTYHRKMCISGNCILIRM